MTCASCANRIERRLNKLEGVTATVNYATENAAVEFDPGRTSPDDLLGAVEAAGYKAALPGAGDPAGEGTGSDPEEEHVRSLRHRLIGAAVLSTPLLLISMIPALQFTYWQWLSLQLAAPVVFCGPPGRSTGRPGRTSSTRPRPWTR